MQRSHTYRVTSCLGLRLVVAAFYVYRGWRWVFPIRTYQTLDGRTTPYLTTIWHDRIGNVLMAMLAVVYYPYAWLRERVALGLAYGTPKDGPPFG